MNRLPVYNPRSLSQMCVCPGRRPYNTHICTYLQLARTQLNSIIFTEHTLHTMRESKNNERHLANIFRSNRLIFVYSVFLALQAGILFLGRQKRSSSGIEFKGAACNSTQNDKVFTGVHQTTHLGSGNATSEKVLVISGHEGTNRDFQYVADEIGLDASYEKPNPFVEYQPMFQITHDRAMAHWER